MERRHRILGFKGFTLVELLVVVAIIALLLGILLPALNRARIKARQTTCATRIRSVATASKAYLNDFRASYPHASWAIPWYTDEELEAGIDTPLAWTQQMAEYLDEEAKALFGGCPSFPNAEDNIHYFLSGRAAYANVDFQLTPQSRWSGIGGLVHPGLNDNLIKYPGAFILGGDCNRRFSIDDADRDDYVDPCLLFGDEYQAYNGSHQAYHAGGLNVMFADSHVAYFREFEYGKMTYRYRKMADFDGNTPSDL